jgi:hypothetical protein
MYKLVKNKTANTASVVETTTDQVVHTYSMSDPDYEKSAKILLRGLNMGGGFDGWTPEFLLCRFAV